MHMPKTLCREFKLVGGSNGEEFELIHVTDNRKRSYHLNIDKKLDKLILIPLDSWGDSGNIPVISFDFDRK